MDIRQAIPEDLAAIRDFYNKQIDDMNATGYPTAWEKDNYPNGELLLDFIRRGELFLGIQDGEIIASMALNSRGNEVYKTVKWQVDIPEEEALVLHLLTVSLERKGQGLGREMIRFARAYGIDHGKQALRLDVHVTNLTAQKLYEKTGFKNVDSVRMFYPGIGWHEFIMCELPLAG